MNTIKIQQQTINNCKLGTARRGFTPVKLVTPTTKKRYLTGFTLIELLIVCAIIAVLATIAIINLTGAKNKSRYARVLSDMESIARAVKSYQVNNNGIYPANTPAGVKPGVLGSYFTENWPKTPCGNTYVYKFINWDGCTADVASPVNVNGRVAIGYWKVATIENIYYFDLMTGMDDCNASFPVFGSIAGHDIKSVSEITCNE